VIQLINYNDSHQGVVVGRPALGNQELLLLNYLAEHGPLSVGEAAENFGKAHGLARTTVLTMMERLRQKGRLTREKVGNTYQYRPSLPKDELQRGLVDEFVRKTLGGSLEPFVSYLAHGARLTEQEIDQLHQLVDQLEDRKKR